jgi:hypothetical protein
MPPLLIWVLGAVGVAAAAKIFSMASEKANADLDRVRREAVGSEDVAKLERNPETGNYRPQKR